VPLYQRVSALNCDAKKVCRTKPQLGAVCSDPFAPCDSSRGAVCVANQCKAITVVAVGAGCDTVTRVCAMDARCSADVCKALPKAGEPCNHLNYDQNTCAYPAACSANDVCEAPRADLRK